MKTIEEIRSSVLAYCEEVCPYKDSPIVTDWGDFVFGYVNDGGKEYEAWFLHIGNLRPISLYALTDAKTWIAAYALLGLAERDAVEALEKRLDTALSDLRKECDFSGRLTDENTALESRNATLVAALEEMYFAYGTTVKIGQRTGLKTVETNIGRDIKSMLSTNTEKGGAND